MKIKRVGKYFNPKSGHRIRYAMHCTLYVRVSRSRAFQPERFQGVRTSFHGVFLQDSDSGPCLLAGTHGKQSLLISDGQGQEGEPNLKGPCSETKPHKLLCELGPHPLPFGSKPSESRVPIPALTDEEEAQGRLVRKLLLSVCLAYM